MQECRRPSPLSCCSGWLGCTGAMGGDTTLENRGRPPSRPACHRSLVLEIRGSRLILILEIRGGAESDLVVSLLYCTVSYCAARCSTALHRVCHWGWRAGPDHLTVMRQRYGIPTGWVGRCQPRTRTGPSQPSAAQQSSSSSSKLSLQLAVRCQLDQLVNSVRRHVIEQTPGKVRRFGDLSQAAGSCV